MRCAVTGRAKTSRWQKDLMAGDVTPAATHVTLRK